MLRNDLTGTDVDLTIKNFKNFTCGKKYRTIYADPPWQFQNRTGKVAPEHKRLNRYPTMKLEDIKALPLRKLPQGNAICIYGFRMPCCRKGSKFSEHGDLPIKRT